MRTFVPQRRYRQLRSRSRFDAFPKQMPARLARITPFGKYILWGVFLLVGRYLLFVHTRKPIQQVTFTPETYSKLSYQPIYDSITSGLLHKGYTHTKRRNRSAITIEAQGQFPIIAKLTPLGYENGKSTIDVTFHTPDFVATSIDSGQRIVYHNTMIPLTSGGTLGSTGYLVHISLPQEAITNFSGGLFRATSSQDIVRSIKALGFGTMSGSSETYTYYPGWEKLMIEKDNIHLTFSLDPQKSKRTISMWQKIRAYMPTSVQSYIDISNPDRIILKD